jgi:hypothetical protein
MFRAAQEQGAAINVTGARRSLAARRSPVSEAILAGLIEGEDESRYEVILTASHKCIFFRNRPERVHHTMGDYR